jgi:putative exosortase-associated protein (TIGR04073 family)
MTARRFTPWRVALAFCLGILLLTPAAWADAFKTAESSTPQEVVGAMAHKLVRGIANTATGWVEFPRQIYETGRDEGTAAGIFVGPLKGVGMTVVRTVTGVGEIVTFFIPYPGFYDPWIEPHFVWQK